MFVLNTHIEIIKATGATIRFGSVNRMNCKRSVASFVDTGSFTLPLSCRVKQEGQSTSSVQSATKFDRGDKVIMSAGYNGQLTKEFEGFITNVGFSTPCVVEVEGYSYQLRKQRIKQVFAKGTNIRAVLEHITRNTDITLSGSIPGITLQSALVVNDSPATEVLDHLKKELLLQVYFRFNELYVGLQQLNTGKVVKYRLNYNTADDGDLKYQLEDQVRAKVILKTAKADGGKQVYTCGDADGDTHEYIVRQVSERDLKSIAEDHLKKLKYTGYRGRFTGFLQPYCQPGDMVEISDLKYPDRKGTYFAETVEVTCSMSGGRRIIEPTTKVTI